jgi:sigma-B regulation protein RsbU (phosphoserine phosphatase)
VMGSELIRLVEGLGFGASAGQKEAVRREIERLQASASRERTLFDAIVNASPHGIIVCDAEGRLVLHNPASERIWGGSATAGSVAEWGQYRAFHADGRPYEPHDWAMARCLTERHTIHAEEVRIQRFDGSFGVLLAGCAPLVESDGRLEGAVSVFADITALRRAEDQLALITDALPVVVSYIDVDQRYRFLNRTYERWFGRPRSEVLGKTVQEVLGATIFDQLKEPLGRSLAGEKGRIELTAHLPELGERDLEITFIPDFAPDGTLLGSVDLVSDVTDRRAMEAGEKESQSEKERLIGELQRTVKMNELFIGILGHDLRNPLGAILMSATVLSRKVPDDSVGRTVARIISAGERMNRMISQLLDFTRVRASGVLAIEPTRGDAVVVFRQAVDELSLIASGRELRVEQRGDTCGWWDIDRLVQVASNLVGNAVHHGTPDKGVDVRVDGTDAEQVTIAVRNGGMIPRNLLAHVFEPFQSGEVRDRRSGLGLGLFISKEIVAAHRGTLSVACDDDLTTFTVTLPRSAASATPRVGSAP